ncbi:MAG: PDZ domain-containing protein [Planctomycetota bacterium]
MKRILPLLLLCVLPISCVSSRSVRISSSDTLLLQKNLTEGGSTSWRLHASGADRPTLDRTDERNRDVAYLGVRVRTLDDASAARLGATAWSGVRVTQVTKGTAADKAGLRVDDVIYGFDDKPISSEEQFTGLVQSQLAPGRQTVATVHRQGSDGQGISMAVAIVPDSREVTDSATESIELESSSVVRQLTGLQAAELTPELSKEVAGIESPTVYVASVGVGTPAYMAGLRAGDRLLKVDGRDVTDLDDLRGAVMGRARERGIALSAGDERVIETARGVEGPVEIQVAGPLGSHTAKLDVRSDLGEYGSIDIPILFDCDSSVSHTDWSFLDFIFQFGANYRGSYLPSNTRKPARSTFFSMLPFGFYEQEKHPGDARYCVLWFIEWERFE